ncbi:hypothetical protein ACWEL8_09610 [Streptomyces sp. NPDC004690]
MVDDPIRAAAQVTRRVLPRYVEALGAVRDTARVEPTPPYQAAPQEASESLTLVWYPDGALGAPYTSVPSAARPALFSAGFQYDAHQGAFVLPTTYAPEVRAVLVQQAVRRLVANGIGVDFRRAATTVRTPPPARAAAPGARRPSAGQR